MTDEAVAYYNWGRWVVDCECGSALAYGIGGSLDAGQPGTTPMICRECRRITPIRWPPNLDQIEAVLAKRPSPKHRNWFPRSHPMAVRNNLPHGQSVAELDDETASKLGDDFVPPEEQQRRDLDRLLADHGMRLAADGQTLRRL
jgi:hypothetical protein